MLNCILSLPPYTKSVRTTRTILPNSLRNARHHATVLLYDTISLALPYLPHIIQPTTNKTTNKKNNTTSTNYDHPIIIIEQNKNYNTNNNSVQFLHV